MKIHVIYEFKQGPYGGANQFLKAIKCYFEKKGCYTENLDEADIFLYNSSNATKETLRAKRKYPEKLFVERLDGPARLYLYQNKSDKRDLIANTMNRYVADATIFQTRYSKDANYQLGLNKNAYETVIINAPDETIFYANGEINFSKERKTRLLASSWSDNWNKGFELYQYLDKNLDFDRYEMIFVGNSPIKFDNIQKRDPLGSDALADLIRTCDIYVTASENDPCSNSLIEALFCGIPALALKKGGHPEIVGKAGRLFEQKKEIIPLLEDIRNNYVEYAENRTLLGRDQTGELYIEFLKKVYKEKEEGKHSTKRFPWYKSLWVDVILLYVRVSDKVHRIMKR